MEASVGNSVVQKEKRQSSAPRKYWTLDEEEALICAVKELILDGWRAGNGWRPGFYNQVAIRIRRQIPTSNILGEPHVNSKLTVWKKDYNALSTLFPGSGQEIDPVDHRVTIVGTEIWETNVRLNPDLDRLKNKTFPHFEEWKEIFGKDRANGVAAHDLGSTVNQIRQQNAARGNIPQASRFPNIHVHTPAENQDAGSENGEQGESSNSKLPFSRKRKSKASLADEPIAKMMGSFMTDTKDAIVDLSKAISSLKEVDPFVTKVFGELENIPVFTNDERAIAANKIVSSPTGLALFFSMRMEEKISYIRGILREKI